MTIREFNDRGSKLEAFGGSNCCNRGKKGALYRVLNTINSFSDFEETFKADLNTVKKQIQWYIDVIESGLVSTINHYTVIKKLPDCIDYNDCCGKRLIINELHGASSLIVPRDLYGNEYGVKWKLSWSRLINTAENRLAKLKKARKKWS